MSVASVRASSSTPIPPAPTRPAQLVNLREIAGLRFIDDDRPEARTVLARRREQVGLPPAERCRAQVMDSWGLSAAGFASMPPAARADMEAGSTPR